MSRTCRDLASTSSGLEAESVPGVHSRADSKLRQPTLPNQEVGLLLSLRSGCAPAPAARLDPKLGSSPIAPSTVQHGMIKHFDPNLCGKRFVYLPH